MLVGGYVSDDVLKLITKDNILYIKGPYGSFYIEILTRIIKTPYFKQSYNPKYDLLITHHGFDFEWNSIE